MLMWAEMEEQLGAAASVREHRLLTEARKAILDSDAR